MDIKAVTRKAFLRRLCQAGIGGCMCGAVLGARSALAGECVAGQQAAARPAAAPTVPGEKSAARAVKRMEFVDGWVPRFFDALDAHVDEPTRRKIMAANGKACYAAFQPNQKPRSEPATRERIMEWARQPARARSYSTDGEAIILQYTSSAETGQASPEGVCLCPTAEAQGLKTLSPTYCWCSVGYVKEMHERVFGRPVHVELTHSVLMGHPRCRFRITLA